MLAVGETFQELPTSENRSMFYIFDGEWNVVTSLSKNYGERDKTVLIVSLANLEINVLIFQTDKPQF